MNITRIDFKEITIKGFDIVKGEYYQIIGPDDEEKLIVECIQSGTITFKYLRQNNRNVWLINGTGKLLFCTEVNHE